MGEPYEPFKAPSIVENRSDVVTLHISVTHYEFHKDVGKMLGCATKTLEFRNKTG